MKVRPAYAAVVSIGSFFLLLTGIRCAQAAEIKIVSPGAYEDIEGEGAVDEDCCDPYRFQQVFPAADFAALGNQPHWLVDFAARPDQSQTNPVTSHWPDNEVRLSTTQRGPGNLSLSFDDNLGSDVMQFYRGPQNAVADAASGPGPREFYNTEFPAGVTPFLYDPSQGNLLFESIARQGVSPAGPQDKVPGIQTGLVASSPFATQGVQAAASIFQFTFIPVTTGDFNLDGTVDAADYVVWRKSGINGPTGYDTWRTNFGVPGGSVAGAGANTNVPEPATLVLMMFAGAGWSFRRGRSA